MACAREYARQNANLILFARRTDRLATLKQEFSTEFPSIKVFTSTVDVRSRSRVFEAIESLPTDFKRIDILVNNAGLVLGMDPLETVSEEALTTMLDTNVKGLVNVTQACLPGMKKLDWSAIVNISSIAGSEAYANGSIYCASKHAVNAITKSLRHELISTPVNVISIEPGMVETEFSVVRFHGDKAKADSIYKGLTPLSGQDIAETVVFATSRAPHVQVLIY